MGKAAFFYQYRDAANFKARGYVGLAGTVATDLESRIRAALIDGLWFIAEQVGVPALRYQLFAYSNGPTTDDHGWHEFVGIGEPPIDFAPDAVLDAGELVAVFEAAAGRWDDRLSPV